MIWRKVTEFPQYSVSDSGLVRNDITGLVLKPGACGSGYLHVRLHGKYNRLVHRLIATEFVPRPDGADQIHHIDGNKHNNTASNLVWCNQSEHQTTENGKVVHMLLNNTVVQTFQSMQEAARFLGLTNTSNIRRACKTGMKCKGYNWRWED